MKTQEILSTVNEPLCFYSLSFSSNITSSPFFCFILRNKRKIQRSLVYWNSRFRGDFCDFFPFQNRWNPVEKLWCSETTTHGEATRLSILSFITPSPVLSGLSEFLPFTVPANGCMSLLSADHVLGTNALFTSQNKFGMVTESDAPP